MTIIKEIVIPQYILEIALTKGRRAKKNAEGKITNARSLNKPRMKRLNGQDLWVGMDQFLRSKLAKELKKYLYEYIRDMEPIEKFPIGIDMHFYYPIPENEAKLPDLDNMCVWYRKCFNDA